MSPEKTVSDARAVSLAGIALVLGALYVVFGVDWYYKGHLVMCTCELTVDQNSWCYRPEESQYQPISPLPDTRPNDASNPQSSVNRVLNQSIGSIGRCYRGLTQEREYEASYSHRFDLWWNDMFLTDDTRRQALASIVTVIYVAFLGFVAAVLKDWWLPSK